MDQGLQQYLNHLKHNGRHQLAKKYWYRIWLLHGYTWMNSSFVLFDFLYKIDYTQKRQMECDGEAEVMIPAQEYEGEHLVLIDDGPARRAAEFPGLTLTGTVRTFFGE